MAILSVQAGTAAANPWVPEGIQPCFNPGGCGGGGGGGGGGGPWGGFGKGIATGVGIGVGFGVVNSLTRPQPQVIYQQPVQPVVVQPQVAPSAMQMHIADCQRRYKSYIPQTNTWTSLSGQVKQCVSPYL